MKISISDKVNADEYFSMFDFRVLLFIFFYVVKINIKNRGGVYWGRLKL